VNLIQRVLDTLTGFLDKVLRARLLSDASPVSRSPVTLNGASSFHLLWQMESEPLEEVSAVLEVLTPPRVDALYFWALQVEFAEGERGRGGAHVGLQWHPRFPGSTAVNWGGYAPAEEGGGVLAGSASALPGFEDEPNTLSYDWVPQRSYRLRVFRAPGSWGWRAEVADLTTGRVDAIRDLYVNATFLRAPVVWAEVFAPCDAPSVSVRWSGFQARNALGLTVHPRAVVVNYQSARQGGCTNTNVTRDGDGFVQVTNTERIAPLGTRYDVSPVGATGQVGPCTGNAGL